MAFFGVFGEGKARASVDVRSAYLCAPILHFSLDGWIALAYGKWDGDMPATLYPHLFVATASHSPAFSLGTSMLARLYFRFGARFYARLPYPTSFVLYDSHRATLYLGGTGGEKCYLEERDDAFLFSSEPHLLRAPIAADYLMLVKKKEAH